MQPSGRQIEITFEDQTAVVTEVGATLRNYVHGGVAVVEGFASHELPDACRNQVCYPWVNRVGSGEWRYSERIAQVGADNVVTATSNHGLARWRPFSVDEIAAHRCTLSLVLHPLPDYPFLSKFVVTYELGERGLRVTSRVENLDEVDIPFSLGFHPYMAVTTPKIDGAWLTIPAQSYVAVDARMLPTGDILKVEASAVDFRRPRRVDGVELDVTYGDLERDEAGMFTASLRDADGHEIQVSQDEAYPYFQAFSADTLAPARRRTSLALEPMTAPADALRTGQGLIALAPGSPWTGVWGVRRVGGPFRPPGRGGGGGGSGGDFPPPGGRAAPAAAQPSSRAFATNIDDPVPVARLITASISSLVGPRPPGGPSMAHPRRTDRRAGDRGGDRDAGARDTVQRSRAPRVDASRRGGAGASAKE